MYYGGLLLEIRSSIGSIDIYYANHNDSDGLSSSKLRLVIVSIQRPLIMQI